MDDNYYSTRQSVKPYQYLNRIGETLVDAFHYLGLFIIGIAIVYSAGATFLDLVVKASISINDILLLFIYLELAAMVGIYFRTRRMPVRFLGYIAMTALTRLLVGDLPHHGDPVSNSILIISASILLLALAMLVLRYGSSKYPSNHN